MFCPESIGFLPPSLPHRKLDLLACMPPSSLPASLKCKMMATIQIWGDFSKGSRLQPLRGDPGNPVPRQNRPSGSDPRSGQGDGSPTFFLRIGDVPPAVASLLLLLAGNVETNPGSGCYACGQNFRQSDTSLTCHTPEIESKNSESLWPSALKASSTRFWRLPLFWFNDQWVVKYNGG